MTRKKHMIWAARSTRPAPTDEAEKQAIVAACETFIRDILKPRLLPEIRPAKPFGAEFVHSYRLRGADMEALLVFRGVYT